VLYFLQALRGELGERAIGEALLFTMVGAVVTPEHTLVSSAGDGVWALNATEAGLVRVELRQGRLDVVREFPDTEPFVNAGCRLFLTRHGLTVVRRQDVTALRMT
jgi:hypothetical protein